MKTVFPAFVLTLAAFSACALVAEDIEKRLSAATKQRLAGYKADAMTGDYQAMRNIAYVWATDAAREQPQAFPIGCAWYALILDMHKQRVHAGDESNKQLYCGKLTIDQAREAGALMTRLRGEISRKQK